MSRYSLWRTLLAAFLLAAGLLGQAQAADYAVTQASDDGTGAVNTLSWAINQANGNAESDTITLQANVTLAAALPDISSTITIEGGGHFISGNNDANVGSVLYITDTGNLTLNKATVTGGSGSSNTFGIFGGGIFNNGGTVTLTSSTVSGNTASSSSSSFFFSSSSYGGGIYNDSGTVTLTNSTVSGNTASSSLSSSYGGGIYNNGGTVTLTNSTVSGNMASSSYGGGIYSSGTVTLQSSIISGNTAGTGDEIANDDTVTANSYNVFGHSSETTADAFEGFAPGSIDVNATSDGGGTPTALDAILATALADNGGSTQTHALVEGSPAVDLDKDCSTKLTTDQRGYGRPVGLGCDAGAFEYGAVPVFTVTASAGAGGSINPSGAQTVNEGSPASFTVTPDTGYTADAAVGGTCPQGSWNGSIYTTGAIKADCSVSFSFDRKTNMAPIYKLLLK